jgi:hypothetical protein
VLWTDDVGSNLKNSITLDFGPLLNVAAGGAQIQLDTQDPFTAKIEAFDVSGKTLASFREKGTSTGAEDNSAIFIGISSTSANMSKIVLSIQVGASQGDFAINKFDFRTNPLAAATTASVLDIRGPASGLILAPPASSLFGTGQPALPGAPLSGPAAPSAPPASPNGVPPGSDRTSTVHIGAVDAVFAAPHPAANENDTWLFAPLSLGSLDGV